MTRPVARGRALLTALYEAAVAGAAPGPVTTAALRDFEVRPAQRLWLYALGKAAHAMADAAVATLQGAQLRISGGVIVSPYRQAAPCATVSVFEGDHPLPGRRSFTAAEHIGEKTAGMRSDDVAIVLLSGGTTSLVAAPLRGMAESDLGQLFELLLGSGLDIHSMNVVRKRFSRWGAGRLALALAPARTHAFVMSDVLGDDPADIGSGPCTPDACTVGEVIELLHYTGIMSRISPAMRDYLTAVSRRVIPETPKLGHPAFAHVTTRIIGSNRLALEAARRHGADLDVSVECIATPLAGDAATCGTLVADSLLQRARQGRAGCVVWGGETTVHLSQASPLVAHGRAASSVAATMDGPPAGGRCQELALAAARRLADGGEPASRIIILAAGTDGRDGTTDAAGAFADATVWAKIRECGRDPDAALERHDSHAALGAAGALLPQRLTGTNVMDVVIGVVK